MHLAANSAVMAFLRAPLAPTIAIAIASMASFGEANAVDMMDTSEEISGSDSSRFYNFRSGDAARRVWTSRRFV
jgi:hypothetical protein